ncbi:MAG: hypothetical protein D3908_10830, partial [Candidatus Electrothrix sp. AUS4]|nr:hypothetical protein [Candidatus Electrothrix sp. AUS4]
GNGLGGILLSVAGCAMVFTLDALSFFFSAFCTWTTRPAQPQERSEDSMMKRGLFREWLLGWEYLKTKPVLLHIILTNALWSLGGGSVFVLISLLNYREFNNDPVTLGLFFAMTGVGALAAAWIRPQLGRGFDQESQIIGWACIIEGGLSPPGKDQARSKYCDAQNDRQALLPNQRRSGGTTGASRLPALSVTLRLR